VKHYSTERWSDYLRGLAVQAEREEMESHLATGCLQCRRRHDRMQALRSAMVEKIEVPESFLARAKTIFPLRRTPAESFHRRLVALLTFDTLGELAPAGFRGVSEVRRLAYAVEDVNVELMMEPRGTKGEVALTGQISTAAPAAFGQIRLMLKNKMVGHTSATEFGEFQIEFRLHAGLSLMFSEQTGQREIEVPLKQLFNSINTPPGASEVL
jgi:anti-sigma factor RsiW